MSPSVSPAVLETLEHQLKLSLHKVDPNPEFVTHLQYRLTDTSRPSLEERQIIGVNLLLLLIPFLSGLLLLWVIRQFRA
jgi:hypothetical protein